MARYTYYGFSVVTGNMLGELPLRGTTLSWGVNETGDLGSGLSLDLGGLTQPERAAVREASTPIQCGIAVAREQDVIWAGWITGRRWSSAAGAYVLTCPGILAYWTRRLITTTLTWTGVDQLEIARQLLTFGPSPSVPLLLGSMMSGVTRAREIPGSDLTYVFDALTDLAGAANGFEFAVESRRRTSAAVDGVEHSLLLGSPTLGRQVVGESSLLLEYPGNVRTLNGWDEDGTDFATDLWGSTETEEGVQLVRHATSAKYTDLGYPVVQRKVDYSGVTDTAELDGTLAAELADSQSFTNTPTLTVDDSGDTAAGQWTVGDQVRLRVTDARRFARADNSLAPGLDTNARVQQATLNPSNGTIDFTLVPLQEAD